MLQLSQKLTTFLDLCAMLRYGEIAQISLKPIHISESNVSFSLLKPRKSQRARPLQFFSLRLWIEDPLT